MYQEYRIPNILPFGTKGVYLYAGDQSNMGRINIEIKAVAKRGAGENNINDTISNLITTDKFNALVNQYGAAKRLTNFTYSQQGNSIPDNFIENCTYSIDSDRNINVSLSDIFVAKVNIYSSKL